MNAKVSIIIPLYNQKQFVSDAIESAINQTYPNVETIVINDGSTDDPEEVLNRYESNDKVHIIHQKNGGLSNARNTGIRHATGEYIQLLDSDDWIFPEKIEKQLYFMQRNRVEFTYCDIRDSDADPNQEDLIFHENSDMFTHIFNLWNNFFVPPIAFLIKKSLFEQYGYFNESLKAVEDRYLLATLAYRKVGIRRVPFTGGCRRRHEDNMTNNIAHMTKFYIRYYRELLEMIEDSYIQKKFKISKTDLMYANLTFLYYAALRKCVAREDLKQMKKIYKEEGVNFYMKPVISDNSSCNIASYAAKSFVIRLLRMLKSGKSK